ncbi:GYD domain-containing protein [Pseudomonas boanensis]|uniref:GYD domain-containing protein n=1 Tax=Metapseudomonas boanensis TaxID=2822138 RepID=UPI0035D4AE92
MATFITLASFTDQGIRNVKGSPDRAAAFKAMAEQMGISVKAVYWTVGNYDLVLIVEGPEEAAVTLLLKTASLGNVRTQTLRGYSEQEFRGFLSSIT